MGSNLSTGTHLSTADSKWRAVLSAPTEEMLKAQAHLALLVWSQPFPASEIGRVIWWMIAVDVDGHRHASRVGHTSSSTPAVAICDDLAALIHDLGTSAWIVVGRKRRGLALSIQKAGFAVSVGMRGLNRAEAELLEEAEPIKAGVQLNAYRLGIEPVSPISDQRSKLECTCQPLWQPSASRIIAERPDHIVFASDASQSACGDWRLSSYAVVSDHGDIVFDTGMTSDRISDLELDGISTALEVIAAHPSRGATIMCDSADAIAVARAIATGSEPTGGYRGLSTRSCRRFEEAWTSARDLCAVSFEQVPGHAGHPLNTAADEVAMVSRRAALSERSEVEPLLESHLTEILSQFEAPESLRRTA